MAIAHGEQPFVIALGEEMAKFPMRFAKPCYFGDPPSRDKPLSVNSGTVSLLDLGHGPLAVTCFHVIQAYREKLKQSGRCIFMIGSCQLDPLSQLIAEDSALDLAIICLTDQQAAQITEKNIGIGEHFYQPTQWPPDPLPKDSSVAFGGFPGDLRLVESFRDLNFGTYSSGAARVSDAHGDYFVCALERKEWKVLFKEAEPESLGGLSGGPVFLIHDANGVISYSFAGIIFQMHEKDELLVIRQASAMPLGNYFPGA